MDESPLFHDQLLATKFFIPSSSHALIPRPRLIELLNTSLASPLTLVSAPPGFGKTTLLSTWVQSLPSARPRVAWVSLDEGDNEAALFWMYVLAALDSQQPGLCTQLVTYLQTQQAPPLRSVLQMLINRLAEQSEQFLLILDDYHLVTEQAVHTSLTYLVEHLPPQLHLILATRSDPSLPLSLLRARGHLREIRTDELRCTPEEVLAFLRTASKAEALIAKGAQLAYQPSEAVTKSGIVVSMVANDQALEEIVLSPGFLKRLGPNGIHLSMSTVSPATSRKLAELHAEHGSSYVAAPVFGRSEAAASELLWICVAGPHAAKERVQPVLKALGQGIYDFGEDPGAANIVKLCGNFMSLSAMEAMAEALTLAEKSGLDRSAVIDMLTQTNFSAPVYQNYGKMIAEKRHTPAGFRQSLGLKDVNLVREVAEHASMPMPLASLLHDRMLAGIAKGRGDMDWSALALDVLENAGLKLPPGA